MARSKAMANLFGGRRRRRGLIVAIGIGGEQPPPPPVEGGGVASMRDRVAPPEHMAEEGDPEDMVRRGLLALAAQGKPWAKDLLQRFQGLVERDESASEETAGAESAEGETPHAKGEYA